MLDKMTSAMYAATVAEPATLPGLLRWHAIYTCSRHEKSVSRQLRQKQIDCFLPLYRSVRRWKDRRKELELPLFPGYVFVHIDDEDRLDEREVESLRSGVMNGACAEPHPYLKAGRRVRVKHGPMAGMEGILVRKKDRYRVVISIEIIMRSVAVEVDEADVEPC